MLALLAGVRANMCRRLCANCCRRDHLALCMRTPTVEIAVIALCDSVCECRSKRPASTMCSPAVGSVCRRPRPSMSPGDQPPCLPCLLSPIAMLRMRLQHRCVRVRAGVPANMCCRLCAGCCRRDHLALCMSVRVQPPCACV